MNNLIETLPEIPIDYDSNKIPKALCFNDVTKYRLREIEYLNLQKYREIYNKITLLEISNNAINSLKLKGYKSLEKIYAINNKIQVVELNITNLKELNLEGNQITKMFELNSLPLLESLNLNKNLLKKITYEDFKFTKNTLVELKLADNEITFSNVKEFFTLFEQFGKNMEKLKYFEINGNPFSKSKIYRDNEYLMILQCSGIKTLNGKMIETYDIEQGDLNSIKNRMTEEEKKAGMYTIETAMNKILDNKFNFNPTLTNINKELGKYTQLGKINQNSFDELYELIKSYLTCNKKSEEDSNISEEHELEEYETFLLYANLIIDSMPSLETIMLHIIANFSIIKFGKFASRSLYYLKQRMTPLKISEIEKALSSVIIDHLIACEEDYLFPQVIKSLEIFVTEAKFTTSFGNLIRKLIAVFHNMNSNKFLSNNSSSHNKKKDIYLSVVCFISKSSKISEYLSVILTDDSFVNSLVIQVKNLLSDETVLSKDNKLMQILFELLNIICSMSLMQDCEADTAMMNNLYKLAGSGFRDKIEQEISHKLKELINKQDNNESNLSSKDFSYYRKLIIGNLIRSYGALLYRSKDVVKLFRMKNSVPQKIINILVQNELNDPIIISASCDFTLYCLSNKIIKSDEDGIFEEITNFLYNLRYLLPYIFLEKNEFRNACLIAEKYGQKTTNRGKLLDIKYINSEIINNLIVSIVKLIEYFGKNSKKHGRIQSRCASIMSNLNEQNRDFALTSCLVFPDENVKQAVAECFYSLDFTELSAVESLNLYKQTVSMNLSGVRASQIVSIIYLTLNNCFLNYISKGEYSEVEKNKDSIYTAYEMIAKNEEKIATRDMGNLNKSHLSTVLTVFLNNCSCHNVLKNILLDTRNGKLIPLILYYESIGRVEGVSYPVEVEKTKPGFRLENLIACFKDPDYSLSPYNYVSLRILIHIADLLTGLPYPMYEIDTNNEFNEVMQDLKKEILERECDRIKLEELNFYKLYDGKKDFSKYKHKIFNTITLDEKKEEQKNFLISFSILFDFVLGRSNLKNSTNYSKIWKNKFDKNIEIISYKDIDTQEDDIKELYNELEIEQEENIYEVFKKYLRQEEYCAVNTMKETVVDYDHIEKDLIKFNKYGSDSTSIIRKEEEETAHNCYLRSLFISAFIRSIYALLEFPAEKSIREGMIKLLYEGENIRLLSSLVDCTKLFHNNIASKYLTIMRYVLNNSKIVADKVKQQSYLSIISIISYMIKKIVKLFKNDFKITNNDHKILLFEISSCSATISNELEGIEFSKDNLRSKAFEWLISKDVIDVLIKVVLNYMNNEADYYRRQGRKEKEEGLENNDGHISNPQMDDALYSMVTSISYFLGEYISRCKNQAYNIINILNKSYIFESVKLRKTFLREILEYSRLSDLKTEITKKLKLKVNYITRAYVTDYKAKSSKIYLMIVTHFSLEFIKVKDTSDKRKDWDMKEFKLIEKLRIPFENIQEIICFELNNRILIKTTEKIFGFFFFQTSSANMLTTLIKSNYSNIPIHENIFCFNRKDVFNTILEKEEKIEKEKKNEYEGMIEENIIPLGTPKNNSNEQKTNQNSRAKFEVIICSFEIKSFFDFFTISPGNGDLIPHLKIVVIYENKLLIYTEYLNEWSKINVEEIFSKAFGCGVDKNIEELYKCFKLIKEYDLKEIQTFTVYEVDKLKLTFNSGVILDIKIHDDISFVKFKKAIFPYLKENKLVVKDDYYDEIN